MSDRAPTACLITLALALFPAVDHAHHSFSAFDVDTEMTIRGRIVRFEWTNPHTRTWLEVTDDDGQTVLWELEGMGPDYLGRRGWTRNTLEPGDLAKITIHPLRSGQPGGTFLRGTLDNGRVVVMFGR